MDNFIGEQRAVNVYANQEIDTVESSLNKELDGFQSKIDHKFDILQQSISKLTNQLVHQEKENLEEECLTDTNLGEQTQLQQLLQEELMQEPVEAPEELLARETGGGKGMEAGEEPQKIILHSIPINLDPSATAQPKNNPLLVHILPTPAPHATPKTPTAKAIPFTLPALQNLKKLVAFVQTFATTSKTLAVAHTAWHNGWFGCWFRHGAPGPRYSCKLH